MNSHSVLPPLVFDPIYRHYIWGGRRFADAFGRSLPTGDDYAESWELVDRGSDQSVVALGPDAGMTLGAIVRSRTDDLLGRHASLSAFPLLFKFLDANKDLSVQVHPDDTRAAMLNPPDKGKTEAWYIIDAKPGSQIYAGLKSGTTRKDLSQALTTGCLESILHTFEPKSGDCLFIPAGTVHAIGAGLLVAEIQQSSDVTYRLHDWNRLGQDGKPRDLHVDAGLEAITHFCPVNPQKRKPTDDPCVKRLVTNDYFLIDEVSIDKPWHLGGDKSCHFLAVISGCIRLDAHWNLPKLHAGSCVLFPASLDRQYIAPENTDQKAIILHTYLP